jgi:hypothetical protein
MALIALGRTFGSVGFFMAIYADLMGIVLAEAFDLAGSLCVTDFAVTTYFIHVIRVIEGHLAVFRREFHAILDIGCKRSAVKAIRVAMATRIFFIRLSPLSAEL